MRPETLHLSNFHPYTYDLSDDLAGQLDRAFATAFSSADLLDRDRFPAWERVAVEPRQAGGQRWLLRYSGRAMIWVDVDPAGLAIAWTRHSRARSRLLDRAYSMTFTPAQQRAVRAALPLGAEPDPAAWASLTATFGSAWCNARWSGDAGERLELWSLPKAGLVALTLSADGRLRHVELATAARAYDLLCDGAHHNGESIDP
jgi:hypothetical protein